MTSPSYIFDVAADNFPALVLQNSTRNPVVVLYWSPKISASMMLVPRLIRLTTQCNGRFLLALYNIDASATLGPEHGVENVPAVKLYRDRQMIDTLDGDDSETGLRAFVTRHIAMRGATRLYAEAVKAYGADDAERGLQL